MTDALPGTGVMVVNIAQRPLQLTFCRALRRSVQGLSKDATGEQKPRESTRTSHRASWEKKVPERGSHTYKSPWKEASGRRMVDRADP